MATTREFQDMLNEYLPNNMLMEEFIRRDWFLSNVEIDNGWKGGKLIVPFEGARATSVEFGQLADASDVSSYDYVRGYTDTYVEAWGTLKFNHTDLMQHDGKIPETSFLKILPGQVERFLDYMKEVTSIQLLDGPQFATLATDGQAGGTFTVDKIDRFNIGQKFYLQDGNTAAAAYYVTAIDYNTSTVTASATRGGAAANLSAYTTAQSAKCYHPGVIANGSFTSVRSALLSAANGGAASLHNVTKTAWPHLQSINISGADITSSNILDKLFDAYVSVRTKCKGNANTILTSFKHLGSILKLIETQKGPYSVTKQPSASLYGWTEIEITTVKGSLKIVAIQEMLDDVIYFLDMGTMTFRTNGGFRKRRSPDGKEYYEVRATTGYAYLVDMCLFGEMEYRAPGHCAVLHSVSY